MEMLVTKRHLKAGLHIYNVILFNLEKICIEYLLKIKRIILLSFLFQCRKGVAEDHDNSCNNSPRSQIRKFKQVGNGNLLFMMSWAIHSEHLNQ